MGDNLNGGQPQRKTNLMEDKLNERLPLQKTTSKEDDIKVRQPQWTTLLEENLNEEDGRRLQLTTTSMGDDIN